jgi:hypothetical protein
MTTFLTVFAILISAILTIDVSRTIQTLRKERIAIRALARRGAGFDV